MKKLTADDVSLLTLSLRIAADTFDAHAEELDPEKHDRVIAQFEKQSRDARALIDRLEDADAITVEPFEPSIERVAISPEMHTALGEAMALDAVSR